MPKGDESEFNPHMYVRVTGILFIRYMSPPEQLYERLSQFLLDNTEKLYLTQDLSSPSTLGEFVKMLLEEKSYGTVILPRIPVLIDR